MFEQKDALERLHENLEAERRYQRRKTYALCAFAMIVTWASVGYYLYTL